MFTAHRYPANGNKESCFHHVKHGLCMDKAKKCDIMGCVTKNIAANIFRECKMTAGAAR